MGKHESLIVVAFAASICALPGAGAAAAPDEAAYAPLKLYEGKWIATSSDGKTMTIENHCARTGLFFACEQVVGGKAGALVVFLPLGRTDAGETYRTQALRPDATTPGHWYSLTIKGDDWLYAGDGAPPRDRTLNHFSGPDHIHFDVQTSPDGKTWASQLSGDEHRVR